MHRRWCAEKIANIDPKKALARVAYGENGAQLTGWLTWKPIRAGKAIIWWCPEVGEGVTILSEGDLSIGEIIPGSYYNNFSAPSSDPEEFVIAFGDGSSVKHHRGNHCLDVVNVGDVNITTHQNITVKSSGIATVIANGDIIANGKKIKLNGGKGIVTGACICQFTGLPHSDFSETVTAGKN